MSGRRSSKAGGTEPSSPSTPSAGGRRVSRAAGAEPSSPARGHRPGAGQRRGSSQEPESPGGTGGGQLSRHGSERPGSSGGEPSTPYGAVSHSFRESDSDRRAREEGERQAAAEEAREAAAQALAAAAYELEMDGKVQHAKDLGVLVAPVSKARITLRIFTHRQSVFRSHSFLVGSEQGGLSEKLGRVPIQADRTTLEDLRTLIETVCDNNMMRRNPIYQEFLITVQSMPNPYNYSDKELRQYRFAYFAHPSDALPTMIPREEEGTRLASKSVVNFVTDDLLMVARTQLRPDFSLPDPEDSAIGR